MIKSKVRVSLSKLMERNIKENGKKDKCMEKELIIYLMASNTWENG